MKNLIIYHNPRWGKSRGSVSILEKNGIDYEVVEYLKNPISIKELKTLGGKLKLRPKEFIRIKDLATLELKPDMENDEEMYAVIAEYPKILERPIIAKGEKAVIGRPPENVLKLI